MKAIKSSLGQRTRRALLTVGAGLLALGLLALAPDRAAAQPAPAGGDEAGDEAGEAKDDPAVKVERGRGGRKVYRITQGFVIEGRIQKPNAFYVLQRSQINYDWAALKQKFVPRISEAVRKHPF